MKIEQIFKVLQEINERAPKHLKENITREVKSTPTMELVMQKALESPDISEEKKAQIRNLIELGTFSKIKVVEDKKIAKLYDQWLGREINKAIKEGRLPTKSKLKDNKELKELYEKVHKANKKS